MSREMKDSGILWIGRIPINWSISKLKYISCFKQEKADIKEKLDYIGLENVMPWSGKIILTKSEYDSSQALLCNEDDILFGKLRPYLAKVHISKKQQCCSGEFCIISINENDTTFYWLFLISDGFISTVNYSTYGTKMPRANSDFIKNMPVLVPPIKEQLAIRDYLISSIEKIDNLIDYTNYTITEYKKLKQSIITEAVTKGIRKNRPMKDSGVEFIKKIPIDYDVLSLRQLTISLRNGYVGPTKDIFVDDGVKYIQSLHIKNGKILFEKEYYVSEEWSCNHPKIRKDDILIVQTGDIGQVALVDDDFDGANCHALIITTPDKTRIDPEYLNYYFRSAVGKEQLLYYKTGALLPHLNSGKIRKSKVICPKMAEQKEIVSYLDVKCSKIDLLIEKKTKMIQSLDYYRKSLIYEYVTGKKEVPETISVSEG